MRRDRRSIIFSWAFKEFNNLQKLFEAGIRVPKPIARHGNVIVMEYIGTKEKPAPLLRDAAVKDMESVYSLIMSSLRCMYQKACLVHADFSAFNVLMHEEKPVIIDVGQTVDRKHPMALTFLKRDVTNIARFFSSYITVDEEELYQYIVRCENEIY
jgi:RIO kinase 1